ncbi:MAG: AtpZ/AtpI family protein, partial [Chloroflexi bacterium]|nr:AtpZ/AtpI family protein [Chloroflexota bacterium]
MLLIAGILAFQPVFALSNNPQPEPQNLNLSTVILNVNDLPAGFAPLSGSDLSRLESALDIYKGTMPGTSAAKLQNVTGFKTSDPLNPQIVVSGIVAPLSSAEQVMIDQQFANPDEVIKQISRSAGSGGASALGGANNIGDSRLAFSMKVGTGSIAMRLDYVVARRGPVLIEVAYMYLESKQPVTSAADLARLLDDRAVDVVGKEDTATFRPGGPFIPDLTTHIPTPLDVSTKPTVVGTNLLLAALLMLPFAVAAEIFTRTLGEHEETLRRRVRVVDWVARMQTKMETATGSSLKRPGLRDSLKVLGVIFFYGLAFSLLDHTWNPFTIKGLILLGSMMIAYGIVGIADDIFQWRAIRRWGLEADLTVRPTNFLLAAFSTTASRLFTLVPGMMFGTPEALHTDENQFDETKRRSLLKISTTTLTVVGLTVWIPTVITGLLQKLNLSDGAKNAIGGVEAFLLVVFAVALENLFVQMLGMPGSLGHALKQRNRWGWLAGLCAVAFLFYHTLINPRGELATAIQEANVLVFFGIAVAFMILAFGLRFYLGRQERAQPALETPAPRVSSGPSAGTRQADVQPAISTPAKPLTIADTQKALIVLPIGECKKCPVCGEMIKAEARLCRFCRATFTVTVKGYCTESHEVVEVNEEGKCVLCGKEPTDVHVESRLLKAPAVMPTRVMTQEQPLPETSSAKEEGNTKQCPACGKTIKAEALICRFCRAHFEVRERGYCLNDHSVVDVKDGKCVQCGNAAQDVHFDSTLIASTLTKTEQRAAEPVHNVQQTATQTPIPAEGLKRPGCVTAYAILLLLGAGLFALVSISGGASSSFGSVGAGTITAIGFVVAAIYVFLAIGLWQLKNWARITVIIFTGLGIAFGMISIGTAIFAPTPNVPTYIQGAYGAQKMMGIFINIIGMAINSTLFDWFRKNGKYFVKKADATASPVPARQPASAPRKQTVQPSTRAPKPQPQSGLLGELLKKIEVYAEAMHY